MLNFSFRSVEVRMCIPLVPAMLLVVLGDSNDHLDVVRATHCGTLSIMSATSR
jgi:hypothetical protein